MSDSQDHIFVAYEGDNWFKRNSSRLDDFQYEKDHPCKLIEFYQLQPNSILEIGASNGVRLARISERLNARTVAVEPSAEAILDGRTKFPNVEFIRAGASAIPLRESFDLIVINFVLHWVDRLNLFRSLSEVDRLLNDGGYLIIGDFLPSNLNKVRYHHLKNQEVYTYKQNYAATFLASGIYHTVGLMTGDHNSKSPSGNVSEGDRIGTWLLRKMFEDHYVDDQMHKG